jgi:hypothetical protein
MLALALYRRIVERVEGRDLERYPTLCGSKGRVDSVVATALPSLLVAL